MKTAAIVIISDNVLKGLVRDVNSHFLAKSLYDIGFRVDNISIVGNSSQAIGDQLTSLSQRYDVIVTSGGLGDLHRCETYQGIASVFHLNCEKLFDIVKVLYKSSNHSDVIQIENVYVFPGYPPYLQSSFKALTRLFLELSDCVFYTRVLHTKSTDDSIKRVLQAMKTKLHDDNLVVNRIKLDEKLVRISFESTVLESVIQCEKFFKQQLKKLSMDNVLLFNFNANQFFPFTPSISTAISVLEKCFTDYEISEVFLSFNGGKDCTVLLYLTMTVLNRMFPRSINHTLQCVYIQCDDAFEEEENFIREILEYCNLPLITVKGGIRDALDTILSANPRYKAVLMGTRRTDPYSENLEHFQMTDVNWPQVMRVNPILDWNYSEIWDFLRNLHVPYCHLYDEGYTSIGSKHNTKRNPALLTSHGYLPAYLLTDGTQEREGRDMKSTTSKS